MAEHVKTGSLGVNGALVFQNRMLKYLKAGRIHQAILLSGPDKQVKFEIAKSMAKFIFCKNKTATFCDDCSNCRRIAKELHPDLLFVREPEEDQIKIETVREICHQMEIAPIEGGPKICIIEDCHRLNTASSNAFLKSLEEPGANRYFILLTSNPNVLLPTILSRCIQFALRPEAKPFEQSPESQTRYAELLREAIRSKNILPLVEELDTKEETLSFIRFLQNEMHATVTGKIAKENFFHALSEHEITRKYASVLELEGRLRSNANYGLMLETLLRRDFIGV